MEKYKTCYKCKKQLKISNFRKDKSKKDCLYSSCNDCYRIKYQIVKQIPRKEYGCDLCKKIFKPKINQFNNRNNIIYCSRKCEGEVNVKNRASSYYGYRKYILERDGNKCVISGSNQNLQIHHIITRGAGGTNEYANLITLSDVVHREKAHGLELGKYRKIFLDYTNNFKRPYFWDTVMEISKGDELKHKIYARKIANTHYLKQKDNPKYKEKVKKEREKRNKLYKEKYKQNYNSYIKSFKEKYGMTPSQYQYKKQKYYLELHNYNLKE